MIPTLQIGQMGREAGESDPYWPNVSLLMHMDGANGSTTFTDAKTGTAGTAVGNAYISTAQSRFGGASGGFDGAGDSVTFPDGANFEFGAADFTVETFVRFAGYSANNSGEYRTTLLCKDKVPAGGPNRGWSFAVSGTSNSITALYFIGFSNDAPTYTLVSANFSFSLNTWYHAAASRVGNLLYLFVDGVLLNAGGTAFNTTIQNTSTVLRLGANEYDAFYQYYLNGWLDEARITKGVGRYSANFQAPSLPFPNL